MVTATLRPTAPAAVPRGYPRPAPGRLEQGAEVIFDHARKMAARGIAAGNDFMGNVEKTFGTPGPDIGPTPFRPGTVTPGAVIAKLGTAIFAAARSRANAVERQRIADAEMAYQKAQIESLTSAAADRTRRGDIAQGQLDLERDKYLNPNAPQAPLMTPIAGKFAGKEMPVPEFSANAAAGRTAMTVKARDDSFKRDSRDMALITADMQKSGPTSTMLIGRATKLATDMFNVIRNPSIASSPGEAARVRAELEQYGLPKGLRVRESNIKSIEAAQKAAQAWATGFWSNHYKAHVETSRTKLAAIQARQAMGGVPEVASESTSESTPVETVVPAESGPAPLQFPDLEN